MKKQYQKPKVSKINLMAEEAVLKHCKTNNTEGPSGSACHGVPGEGACRGHGS